MINALPVWHCLSSEAQLRLAKIALANGWDFEIPDCEWHPWLPGVSPVDIDAGVDYDKFIRRAPSRRRN